MGRILLVVNPNVPEGSSLTFACHMARLTDAALTGVFVTELFEEPAPSVGYIPFAPAGIPSLQPLPRTSVKDIEPQLQRFQEVCRKAEIPYEVSRESLLQEVIASTAYFDLVILDPATNFIGLEEEAPTGPVKLILHEARCPVLISPEVYTGIEGIDFCYDGSISAAQAIRQFTYLFPQLRNRPVTLVEVNAPDSEVYTEARRDLTGWLRSHYDILLFEGLEGNTRDELFAYLFKQRGKIAVMGSYGRGLVSEFFHHSVANPVLRAADVPLFIYHK